MAKKIGKKFKTAKKKVKIKVKKPAPKKKSKKVDKGRKLYTVPEEEGQRRLESHWDRRHKTEKGYGLPPRSPRYMQDYIDAEARHWQQEFATEGDYGDDDKAETGTRYNMQSPEEKRRRKEREEETKAGGFGQELQDIEDEDPDDESYHPKKAQ